MALTTIATVARLLVALHQRMQLGPASIQRTCKIQRDVRGMVCMGLAEFVRPVVEQLPVVGAFFGNLNHFFVHMCCAKVEPWMQLRSPFFLPTSRLFFASAGEYDAPAGALVDRRHHKLLRRYEGFP